MSKNEQFSPIQEQLVAVSISGAALARDLEAESMGAVPLNEHYIYLGNTLKMFDKVVELDRMARVYPIPRNAGADYMPSKQQAMSRNSAKAAEKMRRESRAEFYKAYGVTALLASELPLSYEDVEDEASKAYDRFTMRYAGSHKRDVRRKASELWKSLVDPSEQLAPNQPETVSEVEQQPGLSTREKLIVLAGADDAGFLPTTNEEKSMVMTYLDYIKNSDFKLGTQNQLVEVGNFHGKHHDFSLAKDYAMQAGRSIAFEFADWYSQASDQLADLEQVKLLLKETINPDLSLAVALHVDMMKAIPLIRFMDLVELRATGKIEYKVEKSKIYPHFDVLRTRRNEDAKKLVPGKNKVLEDPYTGIRTKAATDWLKARMTQIKVRDVRSLIEEAISDQANRLNFHKLVLEDLAIEKTDSEMLKEASKVARDVLQKAS